MGHAVSCVQAIVDILRCASSTTATTDLQETGDETNSGRRCDWLSVHSQRSFLRVVTPCLPFWLRARRQVGL